MFVYTHKPTNTFYFRDDKDGISGSVDAFVFTRNGDLFTIFNYGRMREEASAMPYSIFQRENGSYFTDANELEAYLNNALTATVPSDGATGAQGAKGDTGLKGDTGIQGSAGAQGLKGDTGAKGDAGAQGLKGDKGDVGSVGAQGIKGDTGTTGAKGDTGLTGAQGIQGATGLTGTAGTNATTTAVATQSVNGLMSSADKTKLDGLTPALKPNTDPFVQAVPLLAIGGAYNFTVPVTGAAIGMVAIVNPMTTTGITNLTNVRAVVTAANVVTVYPTAGIALAAGNQTFAIRVIQ